MSGVSEKLGKPMPSEASTLEMVKTIASVTGESLRSVWYQHPLGARGRNGLVHRYIAAMNAIDFGVDIEVGSGIGIRRVMAMVFDDDRYLHPLDRARDAEARNS